MAGDVKNLLFLIFGSCESLTDVNEMRNIMKFNRRIIVLLTLAWSHENTLHFTYFCIKFVSFAYFQELHEY